MKTRVRKNSDSEWVESLPDTSTLPNLKTANSLSRQECICDLEEKLHKAFANARLRGGTDFVYERDCDAYTLLDEFCNWNQMSEPACPLVISGCSGSGKSALLANWLVHYRQRLDHRLSNGGTMEEPFVFCHAVGCTRQGVDVEQLLWRLLADLKQHFNLARNIPSEAARLSWELPGFLELAARKGLVIIIIDGLHRLQDKNEGETGLQWLPLQVPANVRIIVTATLPGLNYLQLQEQKLHRVASKPHQEEPPTSSQSQSRGGDDDDAAGTTPIPGRSTTDIEGIEGIENTGNHHRRKVLMELSRRRWPVLDVSPLQDWRKRDIVEAFSRRSIVGRRSSWGEEVPPSDATWGSKMMRRMPTFLTGVNFEEDAASEYTLKPGLVLFPSMVERILSNKATNSALYLRTLLRALEWAAMNSYDVRALLDTILATASSIRALYNVIFDCIEAGNQPTGASIAAAKAANEADGGLPALQRTVDYLVQVGSMDRRISQHDHHHQEQHQSSSHQEESVIDESLALKAPSQASDTPSQASEAPSHASDAPSQASEAPSHASDALSQAGEMPSQASEAPSQASETPNQASEAPNQAGEASSRASDALSQAGEASSQAGEASSQASDAPSQAGEAPGQAGEAPSQASEAPSQASEAPSQASEAPSQAGDAPSQASEVPSQVGQAPNQASEAPSEACEAPSQAGEALSQASEAPSQAGEAPSQASEAPSQASEAPSQAGEAPSQASDASSQASEAPSQTGHESMNQEEQEEADKGKTDDGEAGKEDKKGGHKVRNNDNEDHYEDDFEEDDECGRNTRRGEKTGGGISHDDQKVLRGHVDTASSTDRDALMVEPLSIFKDQKERREEGSTTDIEKEGNTASTHDIASGVFEKESENYFTSNAIDGSGEVNTLSKIPVYLAGGKKVDGFGVTIGRAMAILHVVRHGLWSEELWAILAALRASAAAQERDEGTVREAESRLLRKLLKNRKRLMDTIRMMDVDRNGVISAEEFRSAVASMGLGLTEQQVKKLIRSIDTNRNGELDIEEMLERFSQIARKMKRNTVSVSRLRKDSANEEALSDETKQSLTSVLSMLGVIHDNVKHKGDAHGIFVLGLDAEDLREVVLRRYVSYTSTWHTRLVRFFQALPPSPRRCEELPWHLKKCYKWNPLKDTLVDLRTFETMWTKTQLKRELMDYWTLLTEGPLYAREESGDLRNNRNSLSVTSQDSSSRGGVAGSVSSADTAAMSNGSHSASAGKVAPFDIVFEYNHAIEGWQALSRPTISRLGEMVHAIGDFMREMSHLVHKENASPPFLHMHLAYDNLKGVGISPALVALAVMDSSPEEERPRKKETMLAKPKGALRDNLSHYRVAPFYYFQRWLWIQFPWMALSSISRDPGIKPDAPSSVEQDDQKGPQPDQNPRFWRVKRVDPFGDPSINVSDDRLRSRLKAELGKSATTTLLDTQSHSTLLGDIGAGMMSSASCRRHTTRAEAEETFGRELPSKCSRIWSSTASAANLNTVTNKASGGFGGFLSEEVSDMSFALPTSGGKKPLRFESEIFYQGSISMDSLRTKGSGGDFRESKADGNAFSQTSRRRWQNKRQDAKARGMADPRKAICTLAGMNPLSPLPGKTLVETESFLTASTSIFTTTMGEAMILEAKDMALKMRRIHDTLQGEVAQKKQKLTEMKRNVEERASQDAYTMSRTTAGERVIKALETRLAKVRSTTAELERVGAFYVRIVDFCIKNPPKDNRHLKVLQEQVFLSKQQTKDLSGKVRDLLLEKDAIERVGIHSLKVQLTRRERAQQKVRARIEQLREQIQKSLKSKRKGRHPREGGNIHHSTPFNARGAGNTNQESSSTPSERQGCLITTNSTLREKQRPESRRDTPMVPSTEEGESLEEALETLAILVGAEDIDDITAKLKTVQEREENLDDQKETATLEAERLHLELEDYQKQLSDLELREGDSASGILVGGGTAISNTALSTTSNETLHCKQRELDDLVLQSGIRLKQARRKANKAKEAFNDLRVGIIHLARVIDFVVRRDENTGTLIPVRRRVRRTMQANMEQKKLAFTHAAVRTASAIEGLAEYEETVAGRVPPPGDVDSQFGSENKAVEQPSGSGLMDTFAIGQEENVCKLLGACEERVCGVMELCGIKADKELGTITTEAMTVYARTTNGGFWHNGLSATTVPIDRQLITEGPGTPSILERLLMGRVKGFESDGAGMDIRTLPPKARDIRFEKNMAEALRKQNEKLEMQEREVNDLDRKAVASFLEDALSSKSANMHLRRANMLMMGKQGKRAGFGLVMDDVLNSAHIDVYNRATTAKKASTKGGCFLGRNDLSSMVLERPAIKASAQVLSSRRKQESRKKASLETNN